MFLIFFREEIREKRTLKVVAKLGFFSGFFWKEDQQWSDDKLYGPI
jgi:hypothetical protein